MRKRRKGSTYFIEIKNNSTGQKALLFSDEETVNALLLAKEKFDFELILLSSLTQQLSPNDLLVLQLAQQKSLEEDTYLIIVESDIVAQPDTLQTMHFKISHSSLFMHKKQATFRK